jgi:hypothetical protein
MSKAMNLTMIVLLLSLFSKRRRFLGLGRFVNDNLFLTTTLITGSFLNLFFYIFIELMGFFPSPELAEKINNFNDQLTYDMLGLSYFLGLSITAIYAYTRDKKDNKKNRSLRNVFLNCFVIGLFGLTINSVLTFLSLILSISGELKSLFEITSLVFFSFLVFSPIGLTFTVIISFLLFLFFKTKSFCSIKSRYHS